MPQGFLLQPEVLIAYIKKKTNDPLYVATNDFFRDEDNDYYPVTSTISYGTTRSAIAAAPKLTQNQRNDLNNKLRGHLRGQARAGCLFDFDSESADEYAIVRDTCRLKRIALKAEQQYEYAIALAKGFGILSAATARAKYPDYPLLPIEFL